MQLKNGFGVLRPCAMILYCAGLLIAAGCAGQQNRTTVGSEPRARMAADAGAPAAATDPGVEREIRGLFVTTAYNTDWPSRPGLDALVAEDEIRAILDRAEELNCNTIFLQVRSFADRIYKLTGPRAPAQPDPKIRPEIPWSAAIDGGQHDPGYDPLAKWITMAHERGLELHAWINPFRVDVPIRSLPIYDGGDGFLYLDPTDTAVQQYVMDVIDDLLQNYGQYPAPPSPATTPSTTPTTTPSPGGDEGIDGIIVDHYYPEPPPGPQPGTQPTTQPLAAAGAAAASGATTLPARRKWILKQWHLAHPPPPPPLAGTKTLTDFIATVANHTDTAKVWFGASPAEGQQVKVTDWLPVVDYIAPEIYVKRPDFQTQLNDWVLRASNASPSPLVVPALYTARVQTRKKGESLPWSWDEINEQINLLDGKTPPLGHIHFSYHAMRGPAQGGPHKDNNLGDKLKANRYKKPAVPHGRGGTIAGAPTLMDSGTKVTLSMPGTKVRYWVFRRRMLNNTWEAQQVRKKNDIEIDKTAELDPATYNLLRVWAIDNRGKESQAADKTIP